MMITLNGERTDVPGRPTVLDVITARGLADKPVAVEVNKQLVPRKQHATHVLDEGDVVELVTFVGGG